MVRYYEKRLLLFPVSLYEKLENSGQTSTETFDITVIIPLYHPAVGHIQDTGTFLIEPSLSGISSTNSLK